MSQKYIIWDELMPEEDIQKAMCDYREDPEYPKCADMSDIELRQFIVDRHCDSLEDEKGKLSGIDLPNGLIITGRIQRGDGNYFGVLSPDKTPETISKCLRGFCNSSSYLTLYVEDGEFYIREAHHDGVNLYQVRAWWPEVDNDLKKEFLEDFADNKDASEYFTAMTFRAMTFRVGDLIGDIYGWEFDGRPACIAQKTKAD